MAASTPESERLLVPRASSVTTMSATLMRLVVTVFSGSKLTVFVREIAVGASLTLVIARL